MITIIKILANLSVLCGSAVNFLTDNTDNTDGGIMTTIIKISANLSVLRDSAVNFLTDNTDGGIIDNDNKNLSES